MKNTYSLVKRFVISALTVAVFLGSATQAMAQTMPKPASLPSLLVIDQPHVDDKRAKILEAYLQQYNSPLASHADTFIDQADKNNIDWKWVAAIAGVESYFGHQIPPYSYNGWGYGVYGNNVRRFASWDEGIGVVSSALRNDYMNSWGAQNIYQIGSFYAADPRWANKVTHFVAELEEFEMRYKSNNALSISL